MVLPQRARIAVTFQAQTVARAVITVVVGHRLRGWIMVLSPVRVLPVTTVQPPPANPVVMYRLLTVVRIVILLVPGVV